MIKSRFFNRLTCFIVFMLIVAQSISSCTTSHSENSTRREFLADCQSPSDGATVRLYKSNGSSATTSDSWIITYQEVDAEELMIFSAYSSPGIKSMQCEQDQIAIVEFANESPTIFLSYAWIKSDLTQKPLTFYKSKLTSPEYKEDVADWEGILIP